MAHYRLARSRGGVDVGSSLRTITLYRPALPRSCTHHRLPSPVGTAIFLRPFCFYSAAPPLTAPPLHTPLRYARMNKSRFDGAEGPAERKLSLSVLYEVLLTLCKTMAPLTPFFVELQYQNLRLALPEAERFDSIHFDMIPQVTKPDAPRSPPKSLAHGTAKRPSPRFPRGFRAPCSRPAPAPLPPRSRAAPRVTRA